MSDAFQVYCDGGSRGNPGPAACAIWLPKFGLAEGHYLGIQTNNAAEYLGLLLALKNAEGYDNVHVFMDSQLVVRQIQGTYAVKSAQLVPYWNDALFKIARFNCFEIVHIPREQNAEADAECNRILDQQEALNAKS